MPIARPTIHGIQPGPLHMSAQPHGASPLKNGMASVYALLLFDVVGYLLVRFGFPLAPRIREVILGASVALAF